ncbi:hypothetical protein ZIOFF_005946 [Zingiber officinale]|uniref:Protein FAR1-RELATED SEQUENCE n=1 Tax=Zingiber officinale TaxID=94328 RepID=A0A8J5M4Q3_ZINOF|nr:hypothetical protein ZIOFF_005946 [Zingiber officinale]
MLEWSSSFQIWSEHTSFLLVPKGVDLPQSTRLLARNGGCLAYDGWMMSMLSRSGGDTSVDMLWKRPEVEKAHGLNCWRWINCEKREERGSGSAVVARWISNWLLEQVQRLKIQRVEWKNDIGSEVLSQHSIATLLASSVASSTSALSLLATQPSRQIFARSPSCPNFSPSAAVSNLAKPSHSPPSRLPFVLHPRVKIFVSFSTLAFSLPFSTLGFSKQADGSFFSKQALTSAATQPSLQVEQADGSPSRRLERTSNPVLPPRVLEQGVKLLEYGKFTCSCGRFLINVGEESVMEEGKIDSSEIKNKNDHVDQDPSTSSINEVKLPEIGMTFSSEEENFVITSVCLDHNHILSPGKSRHFRCNKVLDSVEAGGYENLAFDERKCRNYVSEARRLRHVIKVLIRMKVIEVPKSYIIDRWRKDIKRGYQSISNIYDDYGCGGERHRYNILTPLIQEVQQLCAKNDDNFSVLVEILKNTKEKLIASDLEHSRVEQLEKVSASGVKMIHSPLKVRSRGCPPTKRKQSKIEQIVKKSIAKARKKLLGAANAARNANSDGKKLDYRRVLMDDEHGKTVPNWRPRRLGGGLGTTRTGSEEFTQKHSVRTAFGGREMVGAEADPSCTRAAELSLMTYHKVSTAQRGETKGLAEPSDQMLVMPGHRVLLLGTKRNDDALSEERKQNSANVARARGQRKGGRYSPFDGGRGSAAGEKDRLGASPGDLGCG